MTMPEDVEAQARNCLRDDRRARWPRRASHSPTWCARTTTSPTARLSSTGVFPLLGEPSAPSAPAATMIVVRRSTKPEMKIEIEVTALKRDGSTRTS